MGMFCSSLFGCCSLKDLKKKLTTVVVGPGEFGKTACFSDKHSFLGRHSLGIKNSQLWEKLTFSTSSQGVEGWRCVECSGLVVISTVCWVGFSVFSAAALCVVFVKSHKKAPCLGLILRWRWGVGGLEAHHLGHSLEIWIEIGMEGGVVVVDRAIRVFQAITCEDAHHRCSSRNFVFALEQASH